MKYFRLTKLFYNLGGQFYLSFFKKTLLFFLSALLLIQGSYGLKPKVSYSKSHEDSKFVQALSKLQTKVLKAGDEFFEEAKTFFVSETVQSVDLGGGIKVLSGKLQNDSSLEIIRRLIKQIMSEIDLERTSGSLQKDQKLFKVLKKLESKSSYEDNRRRLTLLRFTMVGGMSGFSIYIGNPEAPWLMASLVAGSFSALIQYANHTFLDFLEYKFKIPRFSTSQGSFQGYSVFDKEAKQILFEKILELEKYVSSRKDSDFDRFVFQEKVTFILNSLSAFKMNENVREKLKEKYDKISSKMNHLKNNPKFDKQELEQAKKELYLKSVELSSYLVYSHHMEKIQGFFTSLREDLHQLEKINMNLESRGRRLRNLVKVVESIEPQKLTVLNLEAGLKSLNLRLTLLGVKDVVKFIKEKSKNVHIQILDKTKRISKSSMYFKWWLTEVAYLSLIPMFVGVFSSQVNATHSFLEVITVATIATIFQGSLERVNIQHRRREEKELSKELIENIGGEKRVHFVNLAFQALLLGKDLSKENETLISKLKDEYMKEGNTNLVIKILNDERLDELIPQAREVMLKALVKDMIENPSEFSKQKTYKELYHHNKKIVNIRSIGLSALATGLALTVLLTEHSKVFLGLTGLELSMLALGPSLAWLLDFVLKRKEKKLKSKKEMLKAQKRKNLNLCPGLF